MSSLFNNLHLPQKFHELLYAAAYAGMPIPSELNLTQPFMLLLANDTFFSLKLHSHYLFAMSKDEIREAAIKEPVSSRGIRDMEIFYAELAEDVAALFLELSFFGHLKSFSQRAL